MLQALWIVPTLPLAGFAVLGSLGRRFSKAAVAAIGLGSVGLSMAIAWLVSASFLISPPVNGIYGQTLWHWVQVGSFTPSVSLYLDALSLTMMLVITFVGFLIHLYSAEFMAEEDGYSRFFAFMNLFVGSMLMLVLADNLLLLYLGWEGVGLCSYLLIGFWHRDPANGLAARKAFIVTRIGDAALALGVLLLFNHLGALDIQELMRRASQQWTAGSTLAVTAAALLLGGAVGKSAQLPLQTWLPDAMAGPTPVSALIHAATMVTAGVYLIARTHVLFSLAPPVQRAVATIGAATLLLAGFSALVQRDIKRVLAYSTMSQVGYMFLGLGVGAWSAAVFHFLSHAFFKSLLFLAAGVVIQAMHEEHDIFAMGGLRKKLPLAFWTFFIGSLALAGLPPTAGFASKDLILTDTWYSSLSGRWLYAAGLIGVFVTSLYTFRMLFLTFYGPAKHEVVKRSGLAMGMPLIVLALLAVLAAALNWPRSWGGVPWLTTFLKTALPSPEVAGAGGGAWLEIVSVCVSLLGIPAAWMLTVKESDFVWRVLETSPALALRRLWSEDWGFDWFYDCFVVRPFIGLAQADRNDLIGSLYRPFVAVAVIFHYLLTLTQTGYVRWYATGVAAGAVIIVALVLFL